MMKRSVFISLITFLLAICACKKDFLNKKPFSDKEIPSTLDDFQQMLDDEESLWECPAMGEISSDDYLIPDNLYSNLYLFDQNTYIWNAEIFTDLNSVIDWNRPYHTIFYINTVLEGIQHIQINSKNSTQYNTIKGTALFIRANIFFSLSQIFAPMYDETAATNPYGIPIRLTSDLDQKTVRSTVKETYDQILNDLHQSIDLLPAEVQTQSLNRPSKPSAFALLARVYLAMADYSKAGAFADSCLRLYSKLIDYNTVSLTSTTPFLRNNEETLYQSVFNRNASVIQGIRLIQGYTVIPSLLQSYHENDLRKPIFFTQNGNVKRDYAATARRFCGLATDEIYLIRAECYARAGKTIEAMKYLNDLLKARWKKNPDGSSTLTDYTASTPEAALDIILTERRKELVIRGVRWSDLRRLNKEGRNITLSRTVNGSTYFLPPNDPRYVLPIPPDVINLTGISQNLR